jgi:hypothetical protein
VEFNQRFNSKMIGQALLVPRRCERDALDRLDIV